MTSSVDLPGELLISDLKTLKLISDPLHRQIFEALISQSLTAKQLSKKLGLISTKIYYHLKLMEEAEIIQVVDTQIVSGIIEKSYRAAARRLQVDPNLLAPNSDSGKENIGNVILSTLDTTREDIYRSLHAHYAELEQDPRMVFISRQLSHLTDYQADEFCEKLDSLIKEFEHANSGSPDLQTFALTIAFYPSYDFET